ncbi:MAG: hypothetical protein R3F56_17190 [Planctomycetota bacterium]
MLGQGMLGAGPTMTLIVATRTSWDPHLRRWGMVGLALAAAELVVAWFWLWPRAQAGMSAAS